MDRQNKLILRQTADHLDELAQELHDACIIGFSMSLKFESMRIREVLSTEKGE